MQPFSGDFNGKKMLPIIQPAILDRGSLVCVHDMGKGEVSEVLALIYRF